MPLKVSGLSGSFPVPSKEVAGSVDTFQQLQQLLKQSLCDLKAESQDVDIEPDETLTKALQRLSKQLQHILAQPMDPMPSSQKIDASTSGSMLPLSPSPDRLSNMPVQVMTACDGIIQMANDAAIEMLQLKFGDIGAVSLAEWIPYDEWRFIRQQLKSSVSSQESVKWLVTLNLPEVPLYKVPCVVTPMLDQSGNVMAWHWDVRKSIEPISSHPFAQLIHGLEVDLLRGTCLDSCLARICEGLVQTFGYPFVWIATVRERQRIQLRAQAVASDFDWELYGPSWWVSISQEEILVQACVASEGSLASSETSSASEFAWFPPSFHLQEAFSLPFSHGDLSGLLVVCSKISKGFDPSIQEWLKGLGHLIEVLIARGMEMEQLRLQSAVVGSVHDALIVTDPQGRVEWVNQAYSKLLGVTLREVLGTPLRSFPHAQLPKTWTKTDSIDVPIECMKTEVMEKGSNGESLVLEQVLTPLIDTQGHITHFVGILHDVTSRVVSEMKMKHQAYHDSLTDLPNRIMFEDRLQLALAQARRDGTLMALLFLDLDNFKLINDEHGHQMGDRLLRIVAKRLLSCVRTTDTVSRLSGDEFTIILQGLDRIQDIRQVAKKIVDCLTTPFPLNGQDISVQTSIGIAVYPKDSTDPRRLLAIADQAMYRAKEFGGQRWHFSTTEWNSA